MYDGVANVQIGPDFASVIDRSWYYVFLTPLGDTRGLYVSVKTPSAFQVRETSVDGTTLAFDYRIVAHPLGASDDRLPAAREYRQAREVHPPGTVTRGAITSEAGGHASACAKHEALGEAESPRRKRVGTRRRSRPCDAR